MPNTLKASQSNVIRGLGTWTHTALNDQMYSVSVHCDEVPASGVSILIQQNGSTKATSTAPASAQNHIELSITLNCAANDVIGVVISSSSPIDNQRNTVKSIIVVRNGQ